MSNRDGGLPIEQFIQALTSQLDRAQDAMALKAHTGRPLTFAVKDMSLELRTHVEMVGSVVRITPAGPGDTETSVLHLSLTTITRPMIEENTVQLMSQSDEPSLKEALGSDLSDEEQRRLEWAGVHTVAQLRDLQQRSGEDAIERVAQVPAQRLRLALERASRPFLSRVTPEHAHGHAEMSDNTPLLRIRGRNLTHENQTPQVRIGGERVRLLDANERELVVAPLAHQMSGTLMVETAPGKTVETEFDFQPRTPTPPPPATLETLPRLGDEI
ncbi:MAG TPA: hypothetical protein VGC89_11825 [Pyrinomonadaceae bacterium]